MTFSSRSPSAVNLPNGGSPLPGILTAGQPSAAQLGDLARSGVKTVIDLRPPQEPRGYDEPAAARAAGLAYHNLPVSAATLGDVQFDEFRKLIGSEQGRPVLVHCASANRVGALLIPYLVLDQGLTAEAALVVAHKVGLRSDDLERMALTYSERRRNSGATK